MEGVYSDVSSTSSSKAPKLKSSTGDVTPINVPSPQSFVGGRIRGRYRQLTVSPIFDPYASPDSPSSPYIRYLRSGSSTNARTPLASVENLIDTPQARSPSMFNTPVKVEEDVLVMDGILVNPKSYKTRPRSSLTPSNSGGRSLTGSNSVGRSSTSSTGGKENNSGNSFNKSDTCRSWEESGSCRFGAKCLFVHGKEELRQNSTRLPNKNTAEICKTYNSSGSCTYGTKCRLKSTVPPTQPEVQPAIAMTLPEIMTPVKSDQSSTSTVFTCDWSPMDDNIEVTLPISDPSKEENVDGYIHNVLYGTSTRKRLQVFAEIYSE